MTAYPAHPRTKPAQFSSELVWITIQPDHPEEDLLNDFKQLTDLCIEKLVSDVCLFRNLTGMPRTIHSMILSTALAQNRTLSISQLMKYSPHEEITLPIPNAIKVWNAFCRDQRYIECKIVDMMNNARTILCTYFCLIEEMCPTSQLQTVDLGAFPMTPGFVESLYNFLSSKNISKCSAGKPYVLQISCTLDTIREIDLLIQALEAAKSKGFKLLIKGLNFINIYCADVALLDLMEKLEPSALELFIVNFATIAPSIEDTLIKLREFKNIKYLNFSYLPYDFSAKQSILIALAEALAELPKISRLILKGNKGLSGCFEVLFQKYCKKNSICSKKLRAENTECCTVHNGLLEYLDVSACRLCDADILFLREMPLRKTLKYLHVNFNAFEGKSAFQSLLALSSSLVVLSMENSFRRHPEYDPELFPVSAFTRLAYLNLRGLSLNAANNKLLEAQLESMQNLKIVIKNRIDENFHPEEPYFLTDFGYIY